MREISLYFAVEILLAVPVKSIGGHYLSANQSIVLFKDPYRMLTIIINYDLSLRHRAVKNTMDSRREIF
jgi:hypothetical protein